MSEKINLRLTHPTLYGMAITFALISVALGLNFLFTNPTFNPYGIDKRVTGSIFFALGTAKLIAILFVRDLVFIRATMAACMIFMMFWGIGTAITYFTGKTSLQLFVLYLGLTRLQYLLLKEPYVNPLTKKGADDADITS